MRATCKVKDCHASKIAAKGMCWKHYRRSLRTGRVYLTGHEGNSSGERTVALHQNGALRISPDLIPPEFRGKDFQVEITILGPQLLKLRFVNSQIIHRVYRHKVYRPNPKAPSIFITASKALKNSGVFWPARGEKAREYRATSHSKNTITVSFDKPVLDSKES